jgi:chromosome segregation ATPase
MGIKEMQEQDSSHFQLGEEGALHDEMLQSELQELKMEKLSHRVTLLTILIPCMIGIILVIAYLDIKDRVARTQDTGNISVQKLDKDIESKFSSLSLEQAKINDKLSNLPALESASAFMQSRLKQIQTSLKQVESSSLHRREFSQALQDINEKFDALPAALNSELQTLEEANQQLKTANQQLADDTSKLSGRLDEILESMEEIKESLKRMDQSIVAMDDQKIGKSELDLALRLKEMAAKQSILEATKSLEKKIQNLEKEIQTIQKNAGGNHKNGQISDTRESGTVKEGATNATPESLKIVGSAAKVQKQPDQSPAENSSVTQSKDIIEQNIE